MKKPLSRRAFLAGAGVAISLPFLDAMVPTGRRRAQAQDDPATRLVFLYVPNGIIRTRFTPAEMGGAYTMPSQLASLEELRSKFSILSGLSNRVGGGYYRYPDGRESRDGPGDHARDTGTFLTCARLRKTDGSDHQNGVSVDQVAANHLAGRTALPSLVMATRPGSYGGDSGYTPIYRANISWADEVTPVPKDANPHSIFNSLFAGFDPTESEDARLRRIALDQSVLDSCLSDISSLRSQLGAADGLKLDGYLTGIRQLETQLTDLPAGRICDPGAAPPEELDFEARMDHTFELIKLAFQCDRTRIATVMMESAGYGFLGVNEAHHQISHLEGGQADATKIETINRWQIEQYASLLTRLNDVVEDEGTLLDNSLVLFGGGLDSTAHESGDALGDLTPRASGAVHRHTNLPLLIAGGARGQFRVGEHRVWDGDPLANLYIKMLNTIGSPAETFGLDGDAALSGV